MWGDRSRDDTDTDAITHTSSARYVMAWSTTNILTFEATNEQVQFENPGIPDIEYNTGLVIWDRDSSTTELSIAAGYTEAERTLDRDDVDDFVFDLDASWQARPTTTLLARARHDLRDQSEALTTGDVASDLPTGISSDLGEVFTNLIGEVGIRQDFDASTVLELTVGYEEENYEDVLRDRESNTVTARLSRELRENLSLVFTARASNDEYTDEDDEVDTLTAGLALDWQVGPRLGIGFGFTYEDRDSDTTLLTRNYDEWVGVIRFRYAAVAMPPQTASP